MGALCPLRNQECVHERCAWYSVINDACCVRQLLRLPASIEALREAVRA